MSKIEACSCPIVRLKPRKSCDAVNIIHTCALNAFSFKKEVLDPEIFHQEAPIFARFTLQKLNYFFQGRDVVAFVCVCCVWHLPIYIMGSTEVFVHLPDFY